MTELKPCPFCGSNNIVMDCRTYDHAEDHSALCNNLNCVAEGPVRTTEEAAITAWNTRATGWVSVNDRMPEDLQLVIWIDNDGRYHMKRFYTDWHEDGYYKLFKMWMPIPRPE